MSVNLKQLYDMLRSKARSYGIATREAALDAATAGKFDGVSITMNTKYDFDSIQIAVASRKAPRFPDRSMPSFDPVSWI